MIVKQGGKERLRSEQCRVCGVKGNDKGLLIVFSLS